jgi:hypothetical protein
MVDFWELQGLLARLTTGEATFERKDALELFRRTPEGRIARNEVRCSHGSESQRGFSALTDKGEFSFDDTKKKDWGISDGKGIVVGKWTVYREGNQMTIEQRLVSPGDFREFYYLEVRRDGSIFFGKSHFSVWNVYIPHISFQKWRPYIKGWIVFRYGRASVRKYKTMVDNAVSQGD